MNMNTMIRATVTIVAIEPGITKYQKIFEFEPEYFSDCNTLEEVRKAFLKDFNDEDRIEDLEIYAYEVIGFDDYEGD
jgi:hypothetical protein